MARSNLYSNSMIKGYRYVCIKRVSDLSLLYELVVSICHLRSNNLNNNNNNVNVSRSSDTGTIAGLWRRRLRINDKSDNGDNVNSSYRRYGLCWDKNRKRRSLCGDESQTSESNSLFWFQQKEEETCVSRMGQAVSLLLAIRIRRRNVRFPHKGQAVSLHIDVTAKNQAMIL